MNGLTLKSSLRAAEMYDLAEHRSMRLQGVAGYARNGRWVNHEMGNFPNVYGLVPRPVRPTCSWSPSSSAAGYESGSA